MQSGDYVSPPPKRDRRREIRDAWDLWGRAALKRINEMKSPYDEGCLSFAVQVHVRRYRLWLRSLKNEDAETEETPSEA